MAYGTPSKVLAGVLSPWVILVISICVLAILYRYYYRPRLFYAYRSYPPSPRIYCTPSYFRRRKFVQEPQRYLTEACQHLSPDTSIFWTDAIDGFDRTTITILIDRTLIAQFLRTDDRDNLSWDAPIRCAWNHLFESSSSFGLDAQFYNSSRYCLVNGFSDSYTTATSSYAAVVTHAAESTLRQFSSGYLNQIVDKIVLHSLNDIMFGPELATRLRPPLQSLLESLTTSNVHFKADRASADTFRALVRESIRRRVDDLEDASTNQDYLQWLLTNFPSSAHDNSKAYHSPSLSNEHTATSLRMITILPSQNQDATDDRIEQLLHNLPDHLLVTYLQTHLLVSVAITSRLQSGGESVSSNTSDPLLFVRKTRKETLLGSTIVPKDSYIAFSPVLQKRNRNSEYETKIGAGSPRSTGLSNMSIVESTDITDFIPGKNPIHGIHESPSTGSFSPLLHNAQSSNVSTNDLTESTTDNNDRGFRRGDDQFSRRYPQINLITLLVTSISESLNSHLLIDTSTRTIKAYGDARSLWVPRFAPEVPVSKIPRPYIPEDRT